MKERLFGKTLAELREVTAESGMPRHAAGQMAVWLYRRGVKDIAAMTDISAANRALLAERFETGLSAPLRETVSSDGTKKYLFGYTTSGGAFAVSGAEAEGDVNRRSLGAEAAATAANEGTSERGDVIFSHRYRENGVVQDDHIPPRQDGIAKAPADTATSPSNPAHVLIESAMIPDNGRDNERATLCLSSQAGCRMGCAFCATGRQGLQRNLTAGEILNQFASLPERDALTNIVYMGMGEPFDNPDEVLKSLDILTSEWGYGWSPTRITVSTAGIAPALERFLQESRVHLAVSLHNPFPDERAQIMPVERAYPVEKIVETLRRYPLEPQRRVSFEYIVMSGLNDTPRHIAGLTKLLGGLSCRVNLIKFHKVPGSPFFSPPAEKMERLRDTLTRKGIRTTIRTSRGEDIEAACGLLSTKELGK